MILVAGATGQLGSEVCRLLCAQGQSVRGIVRPGSDADRVSTLVGMGVRVVEADLRRPDTLAPACSGVDAVVSTATAIARSDELHDVDAAGQQALVDAAAAAGVERFVFVSVSGGIAVDVPLVSAKRAVEARLAGSGMNYTVLRAPCFMEVWLSPMLGFDVPGGNVTIYGDGGAPISYVSVRDVAAFCVESLHTAAAESAVLEVGGPEPVTPLQAVRIAESVTGRELSVQHVPIEALMAQYEAETDPRQKSFAGLMYAVALGDVISAEDTLRVFPLQLRTVREYMLEAFGPLREVDVSA
jgi:uncharacterized protein YbjT (DUF2867 family)